MKVVLIMNSENNRPVWVEINLNNLEYNFNQIKKSVSRETLIMAIVKANAYGHGAKPVVSRLIKSGCDRLGVAIPEEGIKLREDNVSLPIHVLGEVLIKQIPSIMNYNLIPTVSKMQTVKFINQFAKEKGVKKKVHVKIDTGMGRIGVLTENAVEFIKSVNKYSNIKIEGLFSHFADADNSDKSYTYQQWNKFNEILKQLRKKKINIPLCHIANSATIIDLQEMQMDMVRPGIMLFGLKPSFDINNISLKPVLSWKTKIVYLKQVPAGTGISYGITYKTKNKAEVATLPLGYADGYSRLLSNKAEVLIKGKRVPVIGNICMDQFMIDVTDVKVNEGDEVILIGEQNNEKITADEIANLMGTINYEVICGINARVPRVYKC